jgi:hypothetical protein
MFNWLNKLDRDVVILIIIAASGVVIFFSRIISRRGKELKVYNDMLTKKMSAYTAIAKACRVAKDTDQLSAYREVNAKALEVLEIIDDSARDIVMDLVVMTDKKSGRPNKAEFAKLADDCMQALNTELYRKPPKFR